MVKKLSTRRTLKPIRILIVDDFPIVRRGLRSLLSIYSDFEIVAEAEAAARALELATQDAPDVALIDIGLPDMSGIDLARELAGVSPETRTIILSRYDDEEHLTRAIQAGAYAYLRKSDADETLVSAIHAVHRGERLISPELLTRVLEEFAELRQNQIQQQFGLDEQDVLVLKMIVAGATNDEICNKLNWSKATIKRHIQHIFEKFGVASRTEAAAEAVRRGLI